MAWSSNANSPELVELLQFLGNRKTLKTLSAILAFSFLATVIIWVTRSSRANELLAKTTREQLPRVELRSFASIGRRPTENQFYGIVQARRAVNLSSKLTERLVSILVDTGEAVEAGQPLAVLDRKDHVTALAVAQAELAGAQAKLQELRRGPREEEIARAAAIVEERRAIGQMHYLTFERLSLAAKSGAVAPDEVDNANYLHQASHAQFLQAEQQLAELRAGARQEQLAGQTALVNAQQARVSQFETRLAECTLHAPFAGVVQKRWMDEGELVAPMQPILTLVESQVMEVHVGLPPAIAESLQREADPPTIDVKINGKSYATQLASLAPALDPETGTRQAIFELERTFDTSFASGESAEVWLSSRSEIGRWVPLSALTSLAHGMWGLWIASPTVEPGIFKLDRRPIEVLSYQSEWIQVHGELAAHDLFVPSGTSRLSPGQYVVFEGQPSQ